MINTALKNSFDEEVLDERPRVRSLLTGSKELVRYFKKSGNMRLLPTSLKQEVSTRWNTMFYLLKSVMKTYNEIAHILMTNNEMYWLAGIDDKLLRELVLYLEVFKTASLELEATKAPTLQLATPWFYKLNSHCQASPNDSADLAKVKAKVIVNIDRKYVLEQLHNVAAALNPKMRNLKMMTEDEKLLIYGAIRKMTEHRSTSREAAALVDQTSHETHAPVVKKQRVDLVDYEDVDDDNGTTIADEDELTTYLQTKVLSADTILEWWKAQATKLPKLAALARHLLAIPASSAASERVSSVAGCTITSRCTALNPEIVASILFLNSNSSVLKFVLLERSSRNDADLTC